MTTLSYAQMEGYWIAAGGPAAVAPIAAAIGEAESGGNTDAINPHDNDNKQSSYGWLQISNGTHTPPSPNWADPATNAQLGVAKYKAAGNSFSPWGTYDSGAYKAYVSGSTTPATVSAGGGLTGNPNAQTAELAADIQSDCLWGFGGIAGTSWINDLFGSGGNVGSVCILSRSQARGMLGALFLVGGAIAGGFALALLLLSAGERTPTGARITGAVAGAINNPATAGLAREEQARAEQLQQQKAQQKAQRQQAQQARRATQTPQGRHAKTGPNAPARGKHAGP